MKQRFIQQLVAKGAMHTRKINIVDESPSILKLGIIYF